MPQTHKNHHDTTRAPDIARTNGPVVYVIGMWRRIVAAMVDSILLTPVLFAVLWTAGKITGFSLSQLQFVRAETVLELLLHGSSVFFASLAFLGIIALLYDVIFVAGTGKTPGLAIVGAKVIDLYGQRPSAWRTVARSTATVVSLLTLGLGLIWIGFDREKRGLHDWLAGTYVVKQS